MFEKIFQFVLSPNGLKFSTHVNLFSRNSMMQKSPKFDFVCFLYEIPKLFPINSKLKFEIN